MSTHLPASMRGAVLLGPEALEIRSVPVPRPDQGEMLVKIEAATTCGTDVKVFRRGGHPRMLRVPTLFGHEMVGSVVAVGASVHAYKEGDRVVLANSASCGHCDCCRSQRENLCADLLYLNGAFAEYILVPERFVRRSSYLVPETLNSEQAALSEPLACVLHGVAACDLDRFQTAAKPVEVVVYGAGPIGLLFVAALAAEGHSVLLADPNPDRLGVGRKLGAAKTIQVTRGGGQAGQVREHTANGLGASVAVDATGVPAVWSDAIQSVRPGGLVNLFGGCASGTFVPLDTHLVHYNEVTIKGVYHHRPATFARALDMLASGKFDSRLLLSAERPIDQVADALHSMIRKEALKVVIRP